MSDKNILALIQEQGVLPLYYHPDPGVSAEVLKALYAAGIRTVEYTNRGEQALENFSVLRELRDRELPGLQLGIGTVKTVADAKAFMAAGADYIISPGMVPEVGVAVQEAGLLWVPGCMTPTEIIGAEQGGAKLVKLFPGNLLGPSFMSAIKELFPGLLFMPTGGVELEEANIAAWFKAGVCAVGMGSKLISKSLLEKKAYGEITTLTKKALQIVHSIPKK